MTFLEFATKSVSSLFHSLHNRLGRRRSAGSSHQLTTRPLRTESLETRQLLAADLLPLPHDRFAPAEVAEQRLGAQVESLAAGERGSQQPGRQAPPTRGLPRNSAMEIRSIDGTGNNLLNPELGSTGEELLRMADVDYGDGISTPAGEDRPSAREISNSLSAADLAGTRNDRGLSAFIYVWGQFLDHDIDLTEDQVVGGESFAIEVPTGDPQFDPQSTGNAVIPLTRSQFASDTGTGIDNPRQQVNEITAYVDGSQVYGSDAATAASLRAFQGGRLLMTDAGLLPTDSAGIVMAGDIRADENISLTALQTLFVREHNRLADQIATSNSRLTDEPIYQQARGLVIAEIQAITYNEFLPALLGTHGLSRYQGYDATVDPSIANEFSTAAYRFGHSTLNDDIEFFDNDGRAVRDELSLADAFHNSQLLEETGIDTLLKYEASTLAQEIDLQVVDSLRNALFGAPGSGGFDLAALNIQRGRDHGLADYNSTRQAYGLQAVDSFADITSDVEVQEKLAALFGDVNNIDLWVGLLAEDHVRGASVGELTQTIIADQFERIRAGDRLWYENVFQGAELRNLQQTTLSDIIERNTTVQGLQDNVFFMLAEVSGQVTLQSGVDRTDRLSSRPGRSTGVEGVTVELLNDAGEVIDTTTTDRGGNYSFSSFPETGDYHIRLVSSDRFEPLANDSLDLLISSGDTLLRGLNFTVRRLS